MPEKTAPADAAPPDLENAIVQIDSILAEMEGGKLPLNQLISRYEEGVKLVKLCQEQLHKAEQRIQIVTKEAEGVFALKDFKADDEE